MNVTRPDVASVLAGLKDFQRRSVDHVFRRLYLDRDSTHRFLVADEVGLGKTLVARGVIAKAIHHLWDDVDRIDIIYICSNADIARQNINRLNVLDRDVALPSRVTLLPITIRDLKRNRVNFVSLTPATSFDLRSSMGIRDERVLLYWLLKDVWSLKGKGPQNVLQGDIQYRDRFGYAIKAFDRSQIDETLAAAFEGSLDRHIEHARERGEIDIRQRFEELAAAFARPRVSAENRSARSIVIADLRMQLAATCLESLEPDLIVLDEFQRFKSLMTGSTDAAELARGLFEYVDDISRARVLLLSATPYKMFTVGEEAGDDDHYRDFLDTVRFLLNDDGTVSRVKTCLANHRRELLNLAEDGHAARDALQAQLRRVMVRTERLAVTDDRQGMLEYRPDADIQLDQRDVNSYLALQDVARTLDQPDTIEYWKSAPYILNFMDHYQLKRAFDRTRKLAKGRTLSVDIRRGRRSLLPWKDITEYAAIDPQNARLRSLIRSTVDTGSWRLMWIPPSLPYYAPGPPFSDPGVADLTKRLIFSCWVIVPKVVSCLVTYDAERRAIRAADPDARNTPRERERRTGLLRFARSEGRLTGLPVLTILYPSITLAELCDPLAIASPDYSHAAILEQAVNAMRLELDAFRTTSEGAEDERWYWAAPMLLDLQRHSDVAEAWFARTELATIWSGREPHEEAGAWGEHLDEARAVLAEPRQLGRMPADLAAVLASAALAGPANCALRALVRVTGASLAEPWLRDGAASVAWAFRTLFNLPEAMGIVRSLAGETPYWRAAMDYCLAGNLQAVLDEYAHVLRESLGLIDKPPTEVSDAIAGAIRQALSLRTAALRVDEISASSARSSVEVESRSMRGRFALRFSQERSEGDDEGARAEHVRQAFNSPFWPFVLATTSIGQEGLDFHTYCHAVVHWNLPSNPVDLEQREGRVHRYKGHAVRKNLADAYRSLGLTVRGSDPWDAMFDAARADRAPSDNDLVPYWVFAGRSKIERHVPVLPLSRDVERLASLRKSLAVYRMVFGQPRQDDLVAYLINQLSEDEIRERIDQYRIDLSPP